MSNDISYGFLELDLHIQQVIYNINANSEILKVQTNGDLGDFDTITQVKILDIKNNDCLLDIRRYKSKYVFKVSYYEFPFDSEPQTETITMTKFNEYYFGVSQLFDNNREYTEYYNKDAIIELYSYL